MLHLFWRCRVVLLIACLTAASGCTPQTTSDAAPAPPPRAVPVEILSQAAGQNLSVDAYGLNLIDRRAFTDLGLAAVFSEQGFEVDFQSHSVVLLSLGEQPSGGYSAQITALQRKGPELFVQATAVAPGPSDVVTTQMTTPYTAVVTPKLPSNLKLRSDITSLP
ncbi:MAG: protease complex subunit PrcB family protein [Planctomycetota bacterium]